MNAKIMAFWLIFSAGASLQAQNNVDVIV